ARRNDHQTPRRPAGVARRPAENRGLRRSGAELAAGTPEGFVDPVPHLVGQIIPAVAGVLADADRLPLDAAAGPAARLGCGQQRDASSDHRSQYEPGDEADPRFFVIIHEFSRSVRTRYVVYYPDHA